MSWEVTARCFIKPFFDSHGWTVFRGVVSPEQLEQMEAAFDAVLAGHLGSRRAGLWQLPGVARLSGGLLEHLRVGPLAGWVSELLGAQSLRLLQDTLILKQAGSAQAITWHQDYNYTGFLEPAHMASVRLALSSESVESGCMKVLDGSHLGGLRGDFAIFSGDRLEEHPEHEPAEDQSVVRLELEPGDVSVHHCLSVHASFENRSDRDRKTIVAHVFDGACRLCRERLPPQARAHFEMDDDGRLRGDAFERFHPR